MNINTLFDFMEDFNMHKLDPDAPDSLLCLRAYLDLYRRDARLLNTVWNREMFFDYLRECQKENRTPSAAGALGFLRANGDHEFHWRKCV